MAVCKSCGAEIIWVKTKAGRAMPCDPTPHNFTDKANGKTFVLKSGEVVRGEICTGNDYVFGVGYISHFATCPDADRHRVRKAGAK